MTNVVQPPSMAAASPPAEAPHQGLLSLHYHPSARDIKEVRKSIVGGNFEVRAQDLNFMTKIGEGCMAVVYKAEYKGRSYAAKKLKISTERRAQEYNDLVVELEILATIGRHPNLVEFVGACIEDLNNPVILEELMEGGSLQEFLGRLPDLFVLKRQLQITWILDLFQGLDHLHSREPIIMHRDLKPGNLMLTKNLKQLKLADFGMGKQISRADRGSALHKGRTGSARYMAPEVLGVSESGPLQSYTEKADLFSAALIAWYLVTGLQPPMRVSGSDGVDMEPARRRWPDMAGILARLCDKQAEQRPAARDCVALLRALDDARLLPANPAASACCAIA